MSKDQSGFTLVELIVSIGVISIVVTTLVTLTLSIQATQRKTMYMESATRSAQRQMESLRNNKFNNLVAGQTIDFSGEVPSTLPRKKGTVSISEPTAGLKRVDITVEYYEGAKKQEVKLSSLIGVLGITQ